MDRVTDLDPEPYAYPHRPHRRRHGPAGYTDYASYRPWLEDEFWFRCVYCLKRMVWAPTDVWSVDHLVPQVGAPERECDYDNLVLSCQFCNQQKSGRSVPDPCRIAYGLHLVVEPDGRVAARGKAGRRLVKDLRLNHPLHRKERVKMMGILRSLAVHDRGEFERLMGFPADLPDLRRKRAPMNSRPAGLQESCLALRERGALPRVY